MVAWYVLSNESYMNRVINDVLPTTIDVRALVLVPFVDPSAWANVWLDEKLTTLFAQEYQPTYSSLATQS